MSISQGCCLEAWGLARLLTPTRRGRRLVGRRIAVGVSASHGEKVCCGEAYPGPPTLSATALTLTVVLKERK